MTQPQHRVRPSWRYDAAEKAALELETLLLAHGVHIETGSAMETHVLNVLKLVYDKQSGAPQADDVRQQYRTLIGVHEVASSILAVKDSPCFSELLPHLRLLSQGNVLQNTQSSGTDQVTNKLFELLVASWVMQCGSEVELDNPISSRGDNPDVLASLGGKRWGVACKVLHGLHPEGFVGHLTKGIDQIERSSAEIGVVLFSLKNVLPHDEIWPLAEVPGEPGELTTGCWSAPAAPFGILTGALSDMKNDLISYLPNDYLRTLFAGKKSAPGFLLWAHSASAVTIGGCPTPTTIRALEFVHLAPVDSAVKDVLRCLTWGAQVGSHERGPRPL